MSVEELKKEIQKEIENLSPEQLKSVDNFIKNINSVSSKEWDLNEHVQNIMQEREEVLKKLAK
jgi:hypothetical protein